MAADDSALEQLKTPPHSREAEQSLLGGLLLDAQTWDQVAEMVTKEDFYLPEHRLISRRCLGLMNGIAHWMCSPFLSSLTYG